MDLLNVNNRREGEMTSGISEQEEWFEHKRMNRDPYVRGSTAVHRLGMSGSGGNLETT